MDADDKAEPIGKAYDGRPRAVRYKMERKEGTWHVVNVRSGKSYGTAPTRKAALRLMGDAEKRGEVKADEPASPEDTLVVYGGEAKALGDGRVGGYLVLFGSPDETDASDMRDFFTAETDFALETVEAKSAVLYHHGLDPQLKNRRIGVGEMKVDDAGVWIEAQLDLRDAYERALYEQGVAAGKMGWSSGTASHLVRRQKQKNGSHKIVAWPLGLDASITPTPAEPRTLAVSLKTLMESDDPAGGFTVPEDARKDGYAGSHLPEHTPAIMTAAGCKQLHDMMGNSLMTILASREMEPSAKVDAANATLAHYVDMILDIFEAMLFGVDPDEIDDAKAILNQQREGLHANLTLNDHSDSVLAAVKGLVKRLDDLARLRAADGRKLSRERVESIKSLRSEVDALLDRAASAREGGLADPAEVLRLRAALMLADV